jgi:hypothetical protein
LILEVVNNSPQSLIKPRPDFLLYVRWYPMICACYGPADTSECIAVGPQRNRIPDRILEILRVKKAANGRRHGTLAGNVEPVVGTDLIWRSC